MFAKFHKAARCLMRAVVLLASATSVSLGSSQTQTQSHRVKVATPESSKGVWAVRFEPVDDFATKTPSEFLGRIHIYSGQHGEIGYFRTRKQGDKLIGSFLAYDGEQLKA